MRRCSTLVMCLALMLGTVLPMGSSTAYGAEPGSKRDDPVPMGTEARVGDYAVTVLDVTPNADAMVAAANQFNDPPAEGRQFFIARVSITYVGADSGTPWINLSFRAVGNRNVGYSTGDDRCGVVPDGLSDTPELFEGGQIETNVCWSIETVDVDSLVMYAEQYFADGGRVWFSLDATAKPPMSGQKHLGLRYLYRDTGQQGFCRDGGGSRDRRPCLPAAGPSHSGGYRRHDRRDEQGGAAARFRD